MFKDYPGFFASLKKDTHLKIAFSSLAGLALITYLVESQKSTKMTQARTAGCEIRPTPPACKDLLREIANLDFALNPVLTLTSFAMLLYFAYHLYKVAFTFHAGPLHPNILAAQNFLAKYPTYPADQQPVDSEIYCPLSGKCTQQPVLLEFEYREKGKVRTFSQFYDYDQLVKWLQTETKAPPVGLKTNIDLVGYNVKNFFIGIDIPLEKLAICRNPLSLNY